MGFTKKDISNNISINAHISKSDGKLLFDSFIKLIISKSTNTIIKIPNFGSFTYRITPKRVGRNPQTKKEYLIDKRLKLSFKESNNIRQIFN